MLCKWLIVGPPVAHQILTFDQAVFYMPLLPMFVFSYSLDNYLFCVMSFINVVVSMLAYHVGDPSSIPSSLARSDFRTMA